MSEIFVSDEHFNERIINERLHIKLAEFLEEQRIIQKVNVLFSLGDLFDKHQDPQRRTTFDIMDGIADFLSIVQFEKIIFIKGNHDESHFGLHNLKIISLDPRIVVVDSPSLFNIDKRLYYAIPFYKEQPQFQSALKQAPDNAIILMHQTIKGFMLNSKKMSEDGVVIDSSRAPLVISGDLHDFQIEGNIIYVGSPYQNKRDEKQDKRLVVISDNNDISYVQIPLSISQRFIYVNTLEGIDQSAIEGKTLVISGDVKITSEQIEKLRQRGVKVVAASSSVIEDNEAPVIEVDLSSFSVDMLSSIVNKSKDIYFKSIGSDLLGIMLSKRGQHGE